MKIVSLIKKIMLLVLLVVASGAYAAAMTQELNEGGIKAQFSVSDDEFSLAGTPIILEIKLEGSSVCLPTPPIDKDIIPYLYGFELESYFVEELGTSGFARSYNYKLIPSADPEYSSTVRMIYPIAISILDSSSSPAKEKIVFSKKFTFSVEKINLDAQVMHSNEPEHIEYNHWITVKYIGFALLGLLVLVLLYLLFRKLYRKYKLKMLTPRERAYRELEQLISKRLLDKGFVEEFYVELTHIIRRYIERKYGIRAPERTTEEFIAEAIASEEFPSEHIPVLTDFLASADMVKFAKQSVSKATAFSATTAVRNFIDLDYYIEPVKPERNGK